MLNFGNDWMENLSNNPARQIITYPDDMMLNLTQSKATFIIQRAVKANETFKSRSPGWSQSIPLLFPQLKRPPGTICHQEKDMTLHSTFLLLFLSATLASCHLPTAQRAARELKESVRERRRIGQTRTQDRQSRSVSTLKVLDFSADGDQQPDSDNEYTGATLEAGPQWLIRLKTQKKIDRV